MMQLSALQDYARTPQSASTFHFYFHLHQFTIRRHLAIRDLLQTKGIVT